LRIYQKKLLLSLAELEAFHFYLYNKNEMLTIVYPHLKIRIWIVFSKLFTMIVFL
jgi:hypothetical protein